MDSNTCSCPANTDRTDVGGGWYECICNAVNATLKYGVCECNGDADRVELVLGSPDTCRCKAYQAGAGGAVYGDSDPVGDCACPDFSSYNTGTNLCDCDESFMTMNSQNECLCPTNSTETGGECRCNSWETGGQLDTSGVSPVCECPGLDTNMAGSGDECLCKARATGATMDGAYDCGCPDYSAYLADNSNPDTSGTCICAAADDGATVLEGG